MSKQPLVPTDKANQLVGSVLAGSSNAEAVRLHDIKPLLHPVFSDLSYEYFHLYYDY